MNPASERFAHEMDAAHYWRQFRVNAYFDKPGEIIGTVRRLTEEGTGENRAPKLVLELDDGVIVNVVARQARLVAELVDKKPVVGDRIRIRYHGEASRAAPGMSKVKEFTVQVRRAEAPAGSGGGHPGGTSATDSPPAEQAS